MDEVRRITKADILGGTAETKWVFIPALKGEVEIKPLTDYQLSRVESLKGKGIIISASPDEFDELKALKSKGVTKEEMKGKIESKMKMDIDIVEITRAAFEADELACEYGMVEQWSKAELNKLPSGAISQIAQQIYDISGIKGGRDALDRFREQL